MSYQVPRKTALKILGLGELHVGGRGSYLECQTDAGVVAFWGSAKNMNNIHAVQGGQVPFQVNANCINPNQRYSQHALWIPEHLAIEVIGSEPVAELVSPDQVVALNRKVLKILDHIEGGRPDGGIIPRIHEVCSKMDVPKRIKAAMILIAQTRHDIEHDETTPTQSALKSALLAGESVEEWARSKGYL